MRHERGLNFWGEGVSSQVGMAVGVVAYPAHARLRGVGGAGKGREFGNDLSQVRGSAAQASGQRSEGVEVPTQCCSDADELFPSSEQINVSGLAQPYNSYHFLRANQSILVCSKNKIRIKTPQWPLPTYTTTPYNNKNKHQTQR